MPKQLSTRAFKFLQKTARKLGLQHNDEDVFEMGTRLLALSDVVSGFNEKENRFEILLNEQEINALRVLRNQFTLTGRICSARELSRALGYQSSRSGHILLHRLITKGVLVKRTGQLAFSK